MHTSHNHTQSIILKDGRRLGYAVYGKADGYPIMLFHGTPGSRLWFAEDDEMTLALGLRLIAPERPGYGISDPKKSRTILDWPDDVAELAEQLGLQQFSVLGVSGGGVYAAACAYKIPHKLKAAALVSTMAPFEGGKTPKSMCKPNKMAFYLSRYFPFLLRMNYRQQKRLIQKAPDKYVEAIQRQTSHLCEQDRQVLQSAENARMFMLHLKEAIRNSVSEAASEPALLSRDWGFSCTEITIPVQLWHGTADTLTPYQEILKLEAMLPNCTTHYIEGGGHFIIENKQLWASILTSLLKPNPEQLPAKEGRHSRFG